MSSDDPDKTHALKDSENGEKASTPPTPTPTPTPSAPSEDIFSSKKHSMNYVTVDGVKLRTGYSNKRDWYFLCIKELLDNAVDFLWDKYKGAKIGDALIDVYIEKTSKSLLRIKVKNSNPRNVEAFTAENLGLIFDFNMTAGSKQNLHIISRGILGDAMKQILALPYVLIHAHDDGTTFANRQWEHPLIVRSNGKEFEVPLHVDLANQVIQAGPIKQTDTKVSSTNTEVQVTLPLIDEVSSSLGIHDIENYCRHYPIFTTDISFKFKLVDNSPDNNNKKVEERERGEGRKQKHGGNGWIEEVAKAIASPAPKAAIKIEYPALHPITEKWNNRASVHSYKPGEFTTFLESVHNKTDVTVYRRINQLAEGTNSKKLPEHEISIADLLKDKSRHKKEERLFWHLRTLLSPSRKSREKQYLSKE